jgi:rare lipoprotein A
MRIASINVCCALRTVGRFVALAAIAPISIASAPVRAEAEPEPPETTVGPIQLEPAPQPAIEPEERVGANPARPAAVPEVFVEAGVASTYGPGGAFQGKRTACGQVFDTNTPQTAHKTFPCGTMLRVEDVETGQSVTVEVTDRGPYVQGRVVDLSWAAFQQLHPQASGLRRVRVYRLGG